MAPGISSAPFYLFNISITKKFSDIFFKNSHVSAYSLLDYIFAGLVKIHSLRAKQNYGNS